MDELIQLHSTAADVEIWTAEKLKYHDTRAYRMGPLVITCVHLEDVGLKG